MSQDTHAVEREQLKILVKQTKFAVLATNVVGAGTIAMIYAFTHENRALVWFGVLVATTLLRFFYARRVQAEVDATPSPERLMRGFGLVALVTGLTWGYLSFMYMDLERPKVFSATILAIGGIVSGAGGSLGAYLPAYRAFAVACIAPITIRFGIRGDVVGLGIGAMSIAYLGALLAFVGNAHRTIIEAIRLRFANDGLGQPLPVEPEGPKEAPRAKRIALAAASHDLRQPVYALTLFSGSLDQRAKQDRDLAHIASRIGASIHALKQLLDGILDISRLDAGSIYPEARPYPINNLLRDIAAEFAGAASKLEVRVYPSSLWVNTDPDMLGRIMRNLVSNAVAHAKTGRVVVGCRRGDPVRLCVWDQGMGIPPEHLDLIFNEFTQLHNSERDRTKGLGLGLAIVRRLAALLEHEVKVVSVLGRGSCFSVTMPRAEPAPLPLDADSPYARSLVPGARVLVIDDEALVRDALDELLSGWDCDVRLAGSGKEAAAIAEDFEDELILADYRLRDHETGRDAVRAVQKVRGEKTPAIIITGDTGAERIREAEATGLPLLHKPLTSDELRRVMIDFFGEA